VKTAAILLLLSASVLGAQQLPWPPPNYLRPALRGQIRDSSTGLPAAGQFSVGDDGRPRGPVTGWPDGHYILFDLVPGTRVLSFYCPTRRRMGRKIAQRVVKITPTTDSVVDFTIDTRACRNARLRSWEGEFRGHYIPGFESSDFEPCTPFADLRGTTYEYERQVAWVSFKPHAADHVKPVETGGEQYPRIYVRWRANVLGPGSYGHMGNALYRMMVYEVLEARRAREGDCR